MANQNTLLSLLSRCNTSVDPGDDEDAVDTNHDDFQWEDAQYGNQYED